MAFDVQIHPFLATIAGSDFDNFAFKVPVAGSRWVCGLARLGAAAMSLQLEHVFERVGVEPFEAPIFQLFESCLGQLFANPLR